MEDLAAELREACEQSVGDWAERYAFLQREFGPPAHMLLLGGVPAMFALWDLKSSYLFGNYLATVLTAQAFAEQTLGGEYRLRHDDKTAGSGFARLIDAASRDRIISLSLADQLHELRRMRNPYTHSGPFSSASAYYARLGAHGLPPEDLAVEDARFATHVVAELISERVFLHREPDRE